MGLLIRSGWCAPQKSPGLIFQPALAFVLSRSFCLTFCLNASIAPLLSDHLNGRLSSVWAWPQREYPPSLLEPCWLLFRALITEQRPRTIGREISILSFQIGWCLAPKAMRCAISMRGCLRGRAFPLKLGSDRFFGG